MFELWEKRAAARSLAQRALARGYPLSIFTGRPTLERLAVLQGEVVAAQEAYVASISDPRTNRALLGLPFEGTPEDAVREGVASWMRSSESLRALCAGRGIHYLHVLQPTLHDEGSKVPTAEERQKGAGRDDWMLGVRVGYPLLREAGRELAARGVAFHDATGVFKDVRETLYYDFCHFGARGNAILAESIGRAFLASLP